MPSPSFERSSSTEDDLPLPIIVLVDDIEHTDEHPFCRDSSCPCHEDREAIARVARAVTDGLLTPEEATDFVSGRLL